MIRDFPLSESGYEAALQWLKESGRPVDTSIQRDLATDGFTIVNLVNHLRRSKGR